MPLIWEGDEVVRVLRAAAHVSLLQRERWQSPLDEANVDTISGRWDDLVDAIEKEPDSMAAKTALLDHSRVVLAFTW